MTTVRTLASKPWVLVLAWVITRSIAVGQLAGWVPYPEGPLMMSDVRLYSVWSILLADGQFPVGDDMWQYPPAAGLIFAAARFAGPNPVIGFVVLSLIADALILTALLIAACKGKHGLLAPWVWVGAAVAIGPIMFARFDVFPTLFAVLVLLLVARPILSGLAAGVGILVKVWPGLMLIALPRRKLPIALAVTVATFVAGWWLVGQWASGAVSFLGEQGGRGLQVESVGALPYVIFNAFTHQMDYVFRFGSMEIDMLGSREAGLALTVLGLALIAGLALLRLLGRLEQVPPADVALAALLVSIATSRVFSPQYTVWIAGVAAVLMLDVRTKLRGCVWMLGIMAFITQVIYPWGYGSLIEGGWFSVFLQTLRIGLLLAATALSLGSVLKAAFSRSRSPAQSAVGSLGA